MRILGRLRRLAEIADGEVIVRDMSENMSHTEGSSSREPQRIPAAGLVRFFEGLVNKSFWELWIWDREIASYVVDLLVRFARMDALYRFQVPHGRRLETVVEFLIEVFRASEADVTSSSLQYKRDMLQHVGDYTLFMSGIFRSYVERHGFLGLYLKEGGKAYGDVARLDRILYRSGAARFEALASEFERISGALDYMRKVYFRPTAERSSYREMLLRLYNFSNN